MFVLVLKNTKRSLMPLIIDIFLEWVMSKQNNKKFVHATSRRNFLSPSPQQPADAPSIRKFSRGLTRMTPTPKGGGMGAVQRIPLGQEKNAFRSTIHASANLPGVACRCALDSAAIPQFTVTVAVTVVVADTQPHTSRPNVDQGQ